MTSLVCHVFFNNSAWTSAEPNIAAFWITVLRLSVNNDVSDDLTASSSRSSKKCVINMEAKKFSETSMKCANRHGAISQTN